MKTIELKAGQQIAQFTTKSVTFDGKEFFYSRMIQNLTHDPATQNIIFTYDGKSKILPYEAKDAQILTAIFSQVLKLQAAKAAQAHDAKVLRRQHSRLRRLRFRIRLSRRRSLSHLKHRMPLMCGLQLKWHNQLRNQQNRLRQQNKLQQQNKLRQQNRLRQKNRSCSPIRKPPSRQKKERKKAEKAAKRAEKERLKAEKAAKKAGKVTEPETPAEGCSQAQETGAQTSELTGTPAESAAEPKELTDEEKTAKKTKLKKSLLIFAAVLVIVAALSVAAYFIFGTSNNPSSNNPGSKESQQYDDIDELINDLQ